MGSALNLQSPSYSTTLTPTSPTAVRLWGNLYLCMLFPMYKSAFRPNTFSIMIFLDFCDDNYPLICCNIREGSNFSGTGIIQSPELTQGISWDKRTVQNKALSKTSPAAAG